MASPSSDANLPVLSQENAATAPHEHSTPAQVIPFDSTDERFIDFLVDEAVREWAKISQD